MRKILVTTDLSEHSLAALEYVSSSGLVYGSRLFLLYVGEHGSKEHASGALREFIERHVEPALPLTPVVRLGHAVREIRRFSQEEGVDLIVIATHGRTGVKHALMGSVAERVVRLSPVPVLSVKPPPVRESLLRDEDIESELHLR
ncbi:MAG TPA: universal stress protein [Bacteroidota bacterium]|nr:universal stress protein [Bacteroidota bacterium]